MTDAELMLKAVLAEPEEDLPRLVYADVIETEEPERAEFIRIQCRMNNDPSHHSHFGNPFDGGKGCGCEYCLLNRREWELLEAARAAWTPFPDRPIYDVDGLHVDFEPRGDGITVLFNRGFVEAVTLSWEDWLTHHEQILAVAPVREVKFTNHPVYQATSIHDLVTCWLVGFDTDTWILTQGEFDFYCREHGTCGMGMAKAKWPKIDFRPPPTSQTEYLSGPTTVEVAGNPLGMTRDPVIREVFGE